MRGTPATMTALTRLCGRRGRRRGRTRATWPRLRVRRDRPHADRARPWHRLCQDRRAERRRCCAGSPHSRHSASRSWSACRASGSSARLAVRRTRRHRLPGSLAAGLFALSRGADFLRVFTMSRQRCRRSGSGKRSPARLPPSVEQRTGTADGKRQALVRHRRHSRQGQCRPDDGRDRAAAGPGRRAHVRARQPPAPRPDRQGHAPVRLHDRAGAGRRASSARGWTCPSSARCPRPPSPC